ncbi:MAG: DUF6580 family putative transport protein [Patescibacteria group bacterium]
MHIRRYLTPTNIVLVVLVAFASVARLLPHPPNFAPVAAVALFSGVYLGKRASLIAPVVAMVISDAFLGFHNLVFFTWGGMALVGILGWWVRERKGARMIVAGSLAGSALFYVLTNFGAWLTNHGGLYTYDIAGLTQGFINGLPFLRNTVAGDLFYTGVFFGIAEIAVAWERSRAKRQAVRA